MVVMIVFIDDGARPEHRRRLRRTARPRLRRVLRDGRVHGGVVRVGAVRAAERPLRRRRRRLERRHRLPHLDLARAGRSPASRPPFVGVLIGLPTLRLRGDYLAIVTLGFGEILPQIARNGDNLFGRLQPDERPGGITPIDAPGFGSWQLPRRAGHVLQLATRAVLLDRDRSCCLITIFCSVRLRDSRLGPRVDRDPRGRDRGRRDGRAADAHEDVGLRDRRVLRRRRRRVLRAASRAARSRTTSSSTSPSSSSAWSSSAGWATSGASSSAPCFLAYLDREGLAEHRRAGSTTTSARHLDVPRYRVRDLRADHRASSMLFRPRG